MYSYIHGLQPHCTYKSHFIIHVSNQISKKHIKSTPEDHRWRSNHPPQTPLEFSANPKAVHVFSIFTRLCNKEGRNE